jgi:ferredoxin
MAELDHRYPDNARGSFYVDRQCIDCDLCREIAPDGFTRNDDGGYSYVCRQPGDAEEEAVWRLALASCPVDAIGDDG